MVLAPAASGADRMWVGFHDDPSFRWEGDRAATVSQAARVNANVVRAIVTWAAAAPTRPTRATNPFDRAYRLDDLDEMVRRAQARGMEVLITIWGTPKWASGGKGPNAMPKRTSDLKDFAQAVAARYSGRYPGYPFVRFWSVWNESNLQLFLTPQFNASGKMVGPANYARLYAAAYEGIKAGNRRALVGMGETSSHGRDRRVAGLSDTIRPGTFARLVAQANPRLKFDAWSHHPYPLPVFMPPTQKVLWPNVSLSSLPRFERSLDTWFKRKNIPIWITEYGHETRPGEPRGVSRSTQARYLRQAMSMAAANPRVKMFIWFIWQDSATSDWQSGVVDIGGRAKPALPTYARAAAPLDARNPLVTLKAGTTRATLTLSAREFCVGNRSGARLGASYAVRRGTKTVAGAAPVVKLASDCSVRVPVRFPALQKSGRYQVPVKLNDVHGLKIQRQATLTAR